MEAQAIQRWVLLSTAIAMVVDDLSEAESALAMADVMLARERADREAVEDDNRRLREALCAIAGAVQVEWGEDVGESTRRVVDAIGGGR